MTGRRFDILRSGVGLAHAVPGAVLHLCTPNTPDLVASMHPSADISICAVRETLVHNDCPGRLDLSRWISITEIEGSLQPCGAGIYRLSGAIPEQRWFTTLLSPDETIGLLTRLDQEEPIEGEIDINLVPDHRLGVTAACLSADDPHIDIDDVAVTLHSACLVSELLAQTSRRFCDPDLSESVSTNTSTNTTNTKESNQ